MRKGWVLAGVSGLAALALGGCGGGEAAVEQSSATGVPGARATAAAEGAAVKDVRIVKSGVQDHETWGEKAFVVAYEITNQSENTSNYFVGLDFLDSDGDVLGSTGVTADKLGVGKTHKGDTAPLPAEITNGKLTDIRDVRVSQVDRSAVSP
ncbi:hypothetical protein [Streptomyces anulatus]|uniref:hypothetical protein n=1 Tax=Streptomyces anulatus TaxID=1892 RepID=UPI00386D67BA